MLVENHRVLWEYTGRTLSLAWGSEKSWGGDNVSPDTEGE